MKGTFISNLIGEENHVRHLWVLAAPSTLFYSYLSDRKKRVNDICTTYYCPRRNIKLLCWLCRIGLNKGFFISNSSKNSLLGEYMISLMSFQILHLWGRITSWSPESSGKHGMGREKYLPYKGRNDKNSAFSSTWNDYKLLQPNHISECTVLN